MALVDLAQPARTTCQHGADQGLMTEDLRYRDRQLGLKDGC